MPTKVKRDRAVRQGKISAEVDAKGIVTIMLPDRRPVIMPEGEVLDLYEVLGHVCEWESGAD